MRPLDPPPDLMRMSAEGGATRIRQWNGVEAWVFTRYDDVKSALISLAAGGDEARPERKTRSPAPPRQA